MLPTRSAPVPYAVASRRWNSRTTTAAAGTPPAPPAPAATSTPSSRSLVTTIWPRLISRVTPFHCRNWVIWSMSLVTREVSAPAPLGLLVQHRQVVDVSERTGAHGANAVSLTVNSRRIIRYEQIVVTVEHGDRRGDHASRSRRVRPAGCAQSVVDADLDGDGHGGLAAATATTAERRACSGQSRSPASSGERLQASASPIVSRTARELRCSLCARSSRSLHALADGTTFLHARLPPARS